MIYRIAFIGLAILFNISNLLMAQPDPGGDPGEGSPIPLDGGILYLLAAGGIYGVKKIVDHRKRNKKEDL
jgi:hypothetical protein